MATLTTEVLRKVTRRRFELVHNIWDIAKIETTANIEIIISRLYSLLAVSSGTPAYTNVNRNEVKRCISALEKQIAEVFLTEGETSIHRRLLQRVCSLNTRAPAVVATSNYDLLLERASEAEEIWCLDGFVGNKQRRWSSDSLHLLLGTIEHQRRFRFHPRAFRLLKLHGSISWATDGDDIVAFPDGMLPPGDRWLRRLVYPTPRKVDESFDEPYSSLLRHFSGAINVSNGLLLTLGFSYRDEHLVAPIKDFITRQGNTLIALVQHPEGELNQLLDRNNVICVSETGAWMDGKSIDDSLDIWQLPALVDFLEAI